MKYGLQKAGMWKRISAYLFDLILLSILAVGFATIASGITGYDGYYDKMSEHYADYGESYGVDFSISTEDYEKLSDEEKARYEEASKAMNEDAEVAKTYTMLISLTMVIVTVGLLLSHLCLEFIVPLLFKNGQTLGKKIFGLGVMQVTGVRISTLALFVRAIFGKFTLETMLPVLLVIMMYFGVSSGLSGIFVLALLVLQIALMASSHTNSAIHDILSSTVVIDYQSQMIFDTKEQLLEYKEQEAKAAADKAKYF